MCSHDEMFRFLKRKAEERGLMVDDFFKFLGDKFAYHGTSIGLNTTQQLLILFSFNGYSPSQAQDFFGYPSLKNIREYLAKGVNTVIREETKKKRVNWLDIREFVLKSGFIRASKIDELKKFFQEIGVEERQNLNNFFLILLETVEIESLPGFNEYDHTRLNDLLRIISEILIQGV
ncbi:MAG: hypothetical protein AAF757_10115 [Cyanobacteria bacterium P01_D01_bin.116]